MSTKVNGQTPRQRFRKERQRRANTTFFITIVVLAVLVSTSVMVLRGWLPTPFPSEFNAKIEYAEVGDIPCPSEGATPVDPSSVIVQVLNTTSRQGLAGEATEMLVSAGYAPMEPSNTSPEYAGKVEIATGRAGVDAAYTIARFFPGSHVVLTASTDATVFVSLGTFYDGPLSDTDLAEAVKNTVPFVRPADCLDLEPLDEGETELPASGELPESTEPQSPESAEPQS